VAVQPSEIAVFDFLSDEHVHLPFNEGYLRILRAAYPHDRMWFRGTKGHVERLAPRVADLADIALQPCKPFETPLGLSHHNPLAGRWAARRCLRLIAQESAGRPLRLIALLGFNASLLSVMGRGWSPSSSVSLHMILHSQLGEAMVWRSRNPFIRAGDLISQITRPLPSSVRVVALELGIKEAIIDASPTISPSVVTLEHPVLRSEWAEDPPFTGVGKVKIAFVGHAREAKGFEVFVQLAGRCSRDDIEFHAIGHSSPETDHLDTSALRRRPSKTPLLREEYLAALEEIGRPSWVLVPNVMHCSDASWYGDRYPSARVLVPAAARGIRNLPRKAWTKDQAGPLSRALVAWAKKVPSDQRTTQEYLSTLQTAGDLVALLPPNDAAALRKDLKELRVDVFVVTTVREQMRYDTPRLVVEAGKPFEIILENADYMPHNLLVVKPDTRKKVADASAEMMPDQLDKQGRSYIPKTADILGATKLLENGQQETLKLIAPKQEGDYEYVCTFPGHWEFMWGRLVVTNDVDAYLQAHPDPAPAGQGGTHKDHAH